MAHSQASNPADKSLARVRPFTIADPPPGGILGWQPLLQHRSAMLSCQLTFVADANVIDRLVHFEVASGAAVSILGITDTVLTAGNSYLINFSVGITPSEPVGGAFRFVPIVGDIFITTSDFFRINVTNIQVADQISDIFTWQQQIIAP